MSRYLLSGAAQSAFRKTTFPLGTLAVNVLGCLAIGVLFELGEARGAFNETTRAFLFIGVLGGFTTFSAFSNETVLLMRDGQGAHAALNVVASLVLCLAAVWLGRVSAGAIWR